MKYTRSHMHGWRYEHRLFWNVCQVVKGVCQGLVLAFEPDFFFIPIKIVPCIQCLDSWSSAGRGSNRPARCSRAPRSRWSGRRLCPLPSSAGTWCTSWRRCRPWPAGRSSRSSRRRRRWSGRPGSRPASGGRPWPRSAKEHHLGQNERNANQIMQNVLSLPAFVTQNLNEMTQTYRLATPALPGRLPRQTLGRRSLLARLQHRRCHHRPWKLGNLCH